MTSPADESNQPAPPPDRPTRKPRVTDVVEYVHHDVLLGREHTGRGVVVSLPSEDGGHAVIRPLAGHHVQVDPATLTVLTAADIAEG